MCGIVGYIGGDEKKRLLLGGLKELEYRGYDSAGIAVMKDGKIEAFKAIGKLTNLEEKTKNFTSEGMGIGIGHTRWATHGKPTEINAHPHFGEHSYIVHNGIIENYREIKEMLLKEGVTFLSQTDTEVVVYLFEHNLKTSATPAEAFEKTILSLKGAYAILLITTIAPDSIFFAKNTAPLIIGKNDKNGLFFGSSDAPLIGHAKEVCYLEDGQYGELKIDSISLFQNAKKITPVFK
ncbi:MAG: glutamine--fructose-6-phosphate transaminase (isomerizing), partial [Campylobacteraceae bacterium]|nr:glutamine--fructose-6-phosphate transaminase (isomerizing) [Campylobacteraceae bacterium]